MAIKITRTSPHWDAGGRRLLRELTFLYMHRQGPGIPTMSIAGLERRLAERSAAVRKKGKPEPANTEPRGRARYARLRHFLFNVTGQPHSDELMNDLFRLVVPWFDEARRGSELEHSAYVAQMESRLWFDYFPRSGSSKRRPKVDEGVAAARRAAELADMLAIGFDIAPRDYAEASEHLTGRKGCAGNAPTDSDRAGFLTYRYSSSPGNIILTYTLVTPPSADYPFCWFQNFYRYPARTLTRDCSGVVVRLGNAIYMLGILPPHDGVKLIILPCAPGEADIFSGLIATANNIGTPLMARVVLQRSNSTRLAMLKRHEQPAMMKYPIPDWLAPNKEILGRIRNHIAFQIGKEIVWHEGGKKQNVTAQRMNGIVAELCRGKFSLAGQAFNPADHSHYPFNQALLMYSPDEREKEPIDEGRAD